MKHPGNEPVTCPRGEARIYSRPTQSCKPCTLGTPFQHFKPYRYMHQLAKWGTINHGRIWAKQSGSLHSCLSIFAFPMSNGIICSRMVGVLNTDSVRAVALLLSSAQRGRSLLSPSDPSVGLSSHSSSGNLTLDTQLCSQCQVTLLILGTQIWLLGCFCAKLKTTYPLALLRKGRLDGWTGVLYNWQTTSFSC